MYYILGINSFIAKHLFLSLGKNIDNVRCLSHSDLKTLVVDDSDIVINCCGINSGSNWEEFNQANHLFLHELLDQFRDSRPYLMHLSTLMVNGFIGKSIEDLPDNHRHFIRSKRAGEDYLRSNYPPDRLCIIRPSNIFGYMCRPYANNILVSMVYDKINGSHRINRLNNNCSRNFLSVGRLCRQMLDMINNRSTGTYAIQSTNTVSLIEVAQMLYNDNVPKSIEFPAGEESIPSVAEKIIYIYLNENIAQEIIQLENDMIVYSKLSEEPIKLNRLSQSRGDMVEISSLNSKRLYAITLSEGSVRGNHYHFRQIEHFYQNQGRVVFLVAHSQRPDVVKLHILQPDDLLIIRPNIIHTLVNSFTNNYCELFVSSTQEYIENQIPDTEYINII